jgi:hypothetical protein
MARTTRTNRIPDKTRGRAAELMSRWRVDIIGKANWKTSGESARKSSASESTTVFRVTARLLLPPLALYRSMPGRASRGLLAGGETEVDEKLSEQAIGT